MEKTKYDIATAMLRRIEHVDKLLTWLYEMQNNNRKIMLSETERTTGPHHIFCEDVDYKVFILALEKDKKDCEEAFAKL